MKKHFKKNWVIYLIFPVIIFTMLIMNAELSKAAEQFVGVGGGVDLNVPEDSTFDFSWGYELGEGQFLVTTMRANSRASDFSEDFIQRVVNIEPLQLEIVGIGSVGATSGEGITKLNFGGGVGGFKDLSFLTPKLNNCGVFVGAKFMRNDFATEDNAGGVSRLVFEFIYRWGE